MGCPNGCGGYGKSLKKRNQRTSIKEILLDALSVGAALPGLMARVQIACKKLREGAFS